MGGPGGLPYKELDWRRLYETLLARSTVDDSSARRSAEGSERRAHHEAGAFEIYRSGSNPRDDQPVRRHRHAQQPDEGDDPEWPARADRRRRSGPATARRGAEEYR